MSDLLKPLRSNRRARQAGFSLLEVLTVLFIIGTTAALVTPNLPVLLDRLSFATQRDSVIREINSLPYAALETGQDLVLGTNVILDPNVLSEDQSQRTAASLLSAYPNVNQTDLPLSLRPASVDLPEGWVLDARNPIFYKPTGFCSGGVISLIAGRVTYEFELAPPYCQVSAAQL